MKRCSAPCLSLFLSGSISSPVYRYVTNSAHASEAKAYVDYSLTGTIGVQTTAAGSISAVHSAHALNTHSYEWENPIQNTNVFSFYNDLMDTLQVPRISP
jgi:hypothetical protein